MLALGLLLALLGSSGAGYGQTLLENPKLTPAARAQLGNLAAGEVGQYWLYLDSSVADPPALYLTDRAWARRAKADPVNLLVSWRDYPIADTVLDGIRGSGLRIKRVSRWLKAVVVDANIGDLSRAVALPFVRRVDPARTLQTVVDDGIRFAKPPDIQLEAVDFDYGQSGFQNRFVNSVKLHQAGLTGSGVLIAFFDTGYETAHRAFDSARIVATYDFINDDVSVNEADCPPTSSGDQRSHGTAVLSVVAGNVPDTLMGIAPHADFALAKTEISCDGTEIKIEEYNWIAAAEWADSIGADIINSSLGYAQFTDSGSYTFDQLDGNTTLITIAADIAASLNILVCNSAGNERLNSWGHIVAPSDGDSVLAVGAVAPDSSLATFSSPGPSADGRIKPDITTLGVSVFKASYLGDYSFGSGTSFASPLAAGAAALAMQRNPTLTAYDVLNRIRQTGNRADNPDNDFGYGLLDAVKVANLVIEFDLPPIVRVLQNQLDTAITVTALPPGDPPPSIEAIYLPNWAEFTDNGDGTGVLRLFPVEAESARDSLLLVGSAATFSDTSKFELYVIGDLQNLVTAGPNPFQDSVYVYIQPSAGNVESISIFNAAGEIVWEKVNNFRLNADALTVLPEQWDGRNLAGRKAAAGVYIMFVRTDRHTFRIKLLKTN